MAPRFLTILTGRNLPKITGQSGEPEPSIINEKTVADFTRVVEQTGILKQEFHRENRGHDMEPRRRRKETGEAHDAPLSSPLLWGTCRATFRREALSFSREATASHSRNRSPGVPQKLTHHR
jgi:hypothetical protein